MKKTFIDLYNINFNDFDYQNPLTVGNGDFAITVDQTGFHTFKDLYKNIPLSSFSNLIWAGKDIDKKIPGNVYQRRNGSKIEYMTKIDDKGLYDDLRTNYHKFSLFNIVDLNAFEKGVKINYQNLDLYSGKLSSEYMIEDDLIHNELECFQDSNTLHYNIQGKKINLAISFNEPSFELDGCSGLCRNVKMTDEEILVTTSSVTYQMYLRSNGNVKIENGVIYLSAKNNLELFFGLEREKESNNLNEYWDVLKDVILDNEELNRRMVLSLYLMKVNTLGILPPAETGLTCNSWYGKFHLEMHLLHHLGLIYFGAGKEVLKSMQYYLDTYNSALVRAKEQGYLGARYPKMTDITGKDSPSHIGCLLVWQAPHIITMLSALKQNGYDISEFNQVLEFVADFIASFYVKVGDYYLLDKPLIPAQECYLCDVVESPLFETEYLRFGLVEAKKLLNKTKPLWEDIIAKAITPKIEEGVYQADITNLRHYEDYANDHPSVLMAYSFFKSERMKKDLVLNTMNKVLNSFDLYSMWGWDFPILAMVYHNCDLDDKANEMLLLDTPKNKYLKNGHNPQGSREDLPLYLPGNGALLLAIMLIKNYVKF